MNNCNDLVHFVCLSAFFVIWIFVNAVMYAYMYKFVDDGKYQKLGKLTIVGSIIMVILTVFLLIMSDGVFSLLSSVFLVAASVLSLFKCISNEVKSKKR